MIPIFYAGIGSRETPPEILSLMTSIAKEHRFEGITLRSGGAKGADKAFESGAGHLKEIFYAQNATAKAIELASKYHPAWDRCSEYAKMLHGRNMMILLGQNLDTPVSKIICWTKDGKASGGTGQAMRAAQDYGVPIINLYNLTEGLNI